MKELYFLAMAVFILSVIFLTFVSCYVVVTLLVSLGIFKYVLMALIIGFIALAVASYTWEGNREYIKRIHG